MDEMSTYADVILEQNKHKLGFWKGRWISHCLETTHSYSDKHTKEPNQLQYKV